MTLQFHFKNMHGSEGLREIATDKSQTLLRYFEGNFNAHWSIGKDSEGHSVHLHLVGGPMEVKAEAHAEDFLTAIEQCLNKAERQLRRRKEKVRHRLHTRTKKVA